MASLPGWFPSWIVPSRAIVLGLDLQGGSQLLLEVDQNELVASQAKALRDDVRRILQQESVRAEGGIQLLQRGVQVRVTDVAGRAKLLPKLRELAQPISNPLVGQGGGRTLDIAEQPDGLVRLTLTDAGITDRTRRAVSQGIEVIRRRLDFHRHHRALEPAAGRRSNPDPVPGEQNPERLEKLLGSTAKLEFRMLADSPSGDVDLLRPATRRAPGCPWSAGSWPMAATSPTPSRPSIIRLRSRWSASSST